MTQRPRFRPIVRGTVVGSDMLFAKELPGGEDLELPRQGAVMDQHGVDVLERARGPAEVDAPHVLTADMEFTGGDYVMANADTAFRVLPAARVRYPRLLRHGRVEWEHTGLYFNSGAVVQTLEFELLVDGAQTSPASVLAWPITAVAGFPTTVIFQAWLRIIGAIDGSTRYDLEGRLVMREGHTGNYGTVLDQYKAVRPTIDGTASRNLGFRVRRANNVTDEALIMRSFMCWQTLYRSGT